MIHYFDNCTSFLKLSQLEELHTEERNSLCIIYVVKAEAQLMKEPSKEDSAEELVSKIYHCFLKTFTKKDSKQMSLRRPLDHAIDLKKIICDEERLNDFPFYYRTKGNHRLC